MSEMHPTNEPSQALRRYAELLDKLFWRRATGEVSDDEEERIAEELNDCRSGMNDGEEDLIDGLIAERRAIQATPRLGLRDTRPQLRSGDPPREAA